MMTANLDNAAVHDEAARLRELLSGLKSRGLLIAWLGGCGWSVSAFGILFLMLVTSLGWWGGTLLRITGWTTLGLVTLAVVLTRLVLPVLRLRQPDSVALGIGRRHPEQRSDLLSASQLVRDPRATVFEPLLVSALFRSAHQMLSEIMPHRTVFALRRLTWPALALFITAGGTLSAYVALPHVVGTGFRALFAEPSPPSTEDLHMMAKAPVVGDLSITLRYPEYLRRETRTLDSVSGGMVAPLGTTVILEGKSLIPGATAGEIYLPNGDRSPLAIDGRHGIRGSFVVSGSGVFSVALGSPDLMMTGPERIIEVETDVPPAIRLLRPSGMKELPMDGEVTLELEAEDDHGLSHVDLVLRAGANLELRKTIIRLASDVKRIRTEYRWSPESVRITDQTELQLELEAYDNDTILGPKPGRSDPLTLRFITPQSRHKNVIEKQNRTLDALVDLLAHRLESPVPGAKYPEEAKKRFATLRGETEDLLAKSAKLIIALSEDPLSPKALADTFSQVRDELSNQLMYEARLYEGRTPGDYRNRIGVDRVTSRILENAIIRVDDLLIEQQLSKVVQTGSNLESDRSELSRLLGRYNASRSESMRRVILDAIAAMENEVKELQKTMEAIRGKVGDTYLNPSSLIHMDLLGTLADLRALLANDDISRAVDLVRRLEGDLGRLLAGLEGGLLSFRTDRFGEGERFLGDLLDRVMSLESDQLQLRRETIALKRRYQERLAAVMRGKIDGLVKKQLRRVDRVRRSEDRLKKLVATPGDHEHLERLQTVLGEITLALGQGDLNEARETADDLLSVAEEWSSRSGSGGRVARELDGIVSEASRLIENIDEAYPRAAQLLTEKDIREARIHATSQRLIAAKTRKLRTWIEKQGEETRFLSNRALDVLAKVTRRMTRSVSALEEKRIGPALDEQTAALDALADLREDLKRGDQATPIESRPVVVSGRIDLPDPDDFEVPPEFRDDILEAMRGDLPNQYEDAIKRYYETLVK